MFNCYLLILQTLPLPNTAPLRSKRYKVYISIKLSCNDSAINYIMLIISLAFNRFQWSVSLTSDFIYYVLLRSPLEVYLSSNYLIGISGVQCFCWDFVDILPFSERSISFLFLIIAVFISFIFFFECSLSFLPSDLSQVLLFFIFFNFLALTFYFILRIFQNLISIPPC